MNCTMSTFSIKASVLGDFKDVTLISKRAAFRLQGKERSEVPLREGLSIVCGLKAEGVPEGAAAGAMQGMLDGLRRKVGVEQGSLKQTE